MELVLYWLQIVIHVMIQQEKTLQLVGVHKDFLKVVPTNVQPVMQNANRVPVLEHVQYVLTQ